MTRTSIAALLGSVCLIACAAAQAQNAPPKSSTSTSASMSSPADSSTSTSKPAESGNKDTSRGAKEQSSKKHKCPKNGDTSNVNCKETSKSPK